MVVGLLVLAAGIGWQRYRFPSWLEPVRDDYRRELAALNVEDGVDASEAKQIAGLYMLEYISGCGAPQPPELRDGQWKVALRLGVAGRLSDRFVEIDPKGGAVSSPGGPAFSTFKAFADDLIEGIATRRLSDRE
jgi:hypothetical protein